MINIVLNSDINNQLHLHLILYYLTTLFRKPVHKFKFF